MNPIPSFSEPAIPEEGALSSAGIVAQNLLIARSALELTQQQLADTSGISRATIAQLEAGIGDPRLSTLEMLAATLHIPAQFLLLDQASFRALAALPNAAETHNGLPQKSREELARTLRAGGVLGRLRAASLGTDAAVEAGLAGDAQRVGAAIGAARFAGRGTLLGAHFAGLLERFKPSARSAAGNPQDDSEFNMGEGI